MLLIARASAALLPLALFAGTALVCTVYLLANVAYLSVLPFWGSPEGGDVLEGIFPDPNVAPKLRYDRWAAAADAAARAGPASAAGDHPLSAGRRAAALPGTATSPVSAARTKTPSSATPSARPASPFGAPYFPSTSTAADKRLIVPIGSTIFDTVRLIS